MRGVGLESSNSSDWPGHGQSSTITVILVHTSNNQFTIFGIWKQVYSVIECVFKLMMPHDSKISLFTSNALKYTPNVYHTHTQQTEDSLENGT